MLKRMIAVFSVSALLLSACAAGEVNREQPDMTEQTAVSEQAAVSEQTETSAQPETAEQPEASVQPEASEQEPVKKSPEPPVIPE